MLPVEIVPFNESVVLRARGSELLILPHHVKELKGKKSPQEFTSYFTGEALINRPARKLFEAWLRKDNTLWPRLYKTVHEQVKLDDQAEGSDSSAPKTTAKKSAAPAPGKPEVKAAEKPAKVEKPAVKAEKVVAKAAASKPAPQPAPKVAAKPEPKPTAKVEAKKPEAKKPEVKATAKPAAKKTASKPAAKAPAKKPAKAAPAAKSNKTAAKGSAKKGKGK